MRGLLGIIILVITTVGAVAEDGAQEAYDGCLSVGFDKFKGLCEPADLIGRAVVFECRPQLNTLMKALSRLDPVDRLDIADKHEREKVEEILTRELEYRLAHPCK